jgi:hypothetical protein
MPAFDSGPIQIDSVGFDGFHCRFAGRRSLGDRAYSRKPAVAIFRTSLVPAKSESKIRNIE